MTRDTNILTLSTAPDGPAHLSDWLGSLRAYIVAWATTCADYYQAAALYDRLSALSDTELHRRGLRRSTLAWDVAQACDRTTVEAGQV
jgi:hypothetical protein